ncbi:MAG: hypothetical protein BGO31_03595 [Bacteroidetes bacterium 43-16]|nr:MAG: hypothetical protein BGO31_03595 [Bacteroidetes bacterium 43-16]
MKQMYKQVLLVSIPLCLGFSSTKAQAPGGVSAGLQLWLPSQNYTGGTTWTDASGNARNATKTGTITNTTLYNYNAVPTGFSTSNYFRVTHNTALNPLGGAISVFAVGLPGNIAYSPFMAKTTNSGWAAGWVLATSSPTTDVGFTTGDWNGSGGTGVAKQSGFSTTLPYLVSGFGVSGGVSISNNGNVEASTTCTNTLSSTDLFIGFDGYGNGSFNGNIGEVIMYRATLSASDKLRVQSYLAIKYGLSLNAAGSPNYVNSAGTNIWTGSSHSGYQNNIFGIARDNGSNLYQKQSKSTSDGSISTYLSSLTTTNAANTGTLNDLDAVLLGDNNLSGTTAYSYAAGTAFANGSLAGTINMRSSKIWNAQVTLAGTAGGAYTLNIATTGYNYARYVMVSSNSSFTPASTRIYAVSGGSATGVVVNDGDFVTIGSFQTGPGGVTSGLTLWVNASTPPGATTTWNDLSGSGHNLQLQGGVQSTVSNAYNFNPAITFNGTSHWMRANNILATGTTPGSVYSVQNNDETTGFNKQVFSFGDDDPGFNYLYTGSTATNYLYYQGQSLLFGNNASASFSGNSNTSLTQSLISQTWDFTGVTGSNTYGYNGYNANSTTNRTVSNSITNTWYALSQEPSPSTGAALGSEYYQGNMAENIVYSVNHAVGSPERRKIDSYLGLKYGITLLGGGINSGTYQYTSSTGKVIWNGAGGSTYHFNVAGIGRDDNSALTQKQSKSMNTVPNNQVTMGLGSIAANNVSNTNTFANDNSFLVWGDNNSQNSLATASVSFAHNGDAAASNLNKRMTRIWRVENNGDNPMTQTVKIQFPIASVGSITVPGQGACAQYVIVYSLDNTFDAADTAAVLTVNGTNYEVNHKFPAGVSYFTFAKVNQTAPGTVDLPQTNATPNFTSACLKAVGWKYYYYDAAQTRKAFAINWNGNIEPGGVNGVLTYSPTSYIVTSGGNTCNIMGRLLEILPAGGNYTTNGGVKVRIFFDSAELRNTIVANQQAQTWFKYSGNASATVVANNGQTISNAINIYPSATGEEDGVDYVEFTGIRSFSTFGFASSTSSALPVSLLNFDAVKKGTTVQLDWSTAREQNNKGFEIERSADGKSWTTSGFVASHSANGNSSTKQQYTFTDVRPLNALNFYRLKQINVDGRFDYSNVRSVLFGNEGNILIYPNPAKDHVTLEGLKGDESITIYDASGRLIQQLKAANTQLDINLENLSSGVYNINIISATGHSSSYKIVKEK